MALDLADMVMKMARAKQDATNAEADVKARNDELRKALETLRTRVTNILENPLEDGSFEVAFLDDALAKVNDADRRYEVEHTSMVAARRQAALLEGIVEGLK